MRYHIRLVSYSNTHHLTELSPNAKSRSFKDSFRQTLCCSQSIDFAVSRWLPTVSSTAARSYYVLRKPASLNLSFLRCKLEVVVPSSWLIVKAWSQAEHPCYLLGGQEMLPWCLCCGVCHSLKHHLSVLAAPTSCYRR